MAQEKTKFAIIQLDTLDKLISTLKSMDVRGFESMDALVGSVIILERARNSAVEIPMSAEQEASAEESKEG